MTAVSSQRQFEIFGQRKVRVFVFPNNQQDKEIRNQNYKVDLYFTYLGESANLYLDQFYLC